MPPRRYELSDFEWSIIQPLLPNKPRGVARRDDGEVLNGIYWRLRTGAPWSGRPRPAPIAYDAGANLAPGIAFSLPSQRFMTAICK
jgi:hypothetical protein